MCSQDHMVFSSGWCPNLRFPPQPVPDQHCCCLFHKTCQAQHARRWWMQPVVETLCGWGIRLRCMKPTILLLLLHLSPVVGTPHDAIPLRVPVLRSSCRCSASTKAGTKAVHTLCRADDHQDGMRWPAPPKRAHVAQTRVVVQA